MTGITKHGGAIRTLLHYLVVVPWKQLYKQEHPAVHRFYNARGPHIAGMIAYFGLLSVIPALFLLISLLGAAGQLNTTSTLVQELELVMPEDAVDSILDTVGELRDRSSSLGIVGFLLLIWTSITFLSVTESGLNIVYGVENRSFVHQKLWVLFLLGVALFTMVGAIVMTNIVIPFIDASLPVLGASDRIFGVPWLVSMAGAFFFFLCAYKFLPNVPLRWREVFPGALVATGAFAISVRVLPWYLQHTNQGIVLKAFAGALIGLFWFYLIAFFLLVGATINWWIQCRAVERQLEESGA